MQVHYTTKTFNYFISIACVIAIVICYRELFMNKNINSSMDISSIGEIISINNTVKRKSESFLGWEEVGIKAPLSLNNLIFTHKNSSAKMKVDENTISLGPETMVEILSLDSISLNQGNMEVDFTANSKPLKVNSGNSSFILKSSSAKVSLTNENSISTVEVKEGKINVQDTKTKKFIEVSKNQSVKITNSKLKVYSSKISLISPKNAQTFSTLKPIHFEISSKLDPLELQVSKDASFNKIFLAQPILNSTKQKIEAGNFYWRVKSKENTSEVQNFNVLYFIEPPRLLTPRVNFDKVYYSDKTEIYFSWARAGAKKWLLEIFDDNKNLIFYKETNTQNYLYTTSLEGKYFWSVTPVKSFTEIENQKFSTFVLTKQKVDNIKSITLELKKPNQKVNFSWQSKKKMDSIFQLSQTKDFKNLITTRKLKGSKTSIVFPKIGVYYWRAYSIDKKGVKVYKEPVRLTIKPNPRPKKPKKLPSLKLKLQSNSLKRSFHFFSRAYASTEGNVDLAWQKVENAKEYEIEIYTDRKLKRKIKTQKTNRPSFKWRAPRTGEFYWRYRYRDFWGRLSPFSDISKLEIVQEAKPQVVTSKDVPKKSKPPHNHSMKVSYLMTMVDYKNENESDFNIEGVSTNGFEFNYKTQKLDFSFSTITGEVFDDQDLVQREIELGYLTNYKKFEFSTGIATSFTSVFENKDSVAKNDGTILNYFVFGSANLFWHKNLINSSLKIGYGSGLLTSLATSYYFYSINQIRVFIRGVAELQNSTHSDQDLKTQQFQASMGSLYTF